MTPEYWQKLKEIVADVVAAVPEERARVIERACGPDTELRREVESLLEFEDGCLPDEPAGHLEEKAIDQSHGFIGKQIGKYKIVDVIAAGGMGTVYLAERGDGAYQRQVALKVIKRGMDSEAVQRRFLNERRILASLEHPSIARLIDGGTTDDHVPYFVMEYVEGVPITEYVSANNLTIDERLLLFRKVAAAVAYAHQNLIIHRDLKPSNILVTAAGEPKLLDFGIAKLLLSGNGGLITATQQYVLTPDYASPEQVRGDQLSTATDVYSLGLILYELLTGSKAYRTNAANFGEVLRVVCETMPQPPSRVEGADAGRLKGDLDNIVLKALRKEPLRRYTSVEQFSADIRRHLENLPVIAASDTWGYRTRKFLARNRAAVLATLLIIISLLAGLVTTLYQRDIARRERTRAEQRFEDVRHLANSFMLEVNDKLDQSPIQARELVITRAIEYLDKLAQESDGDPAILSELANAYEKIGDVQSRMFDPGLGKTSAALISHQKALDIRLALFNAAPDDAKRGTDVVRSRMLVGDIQTVTGRIDEARSEYEQAIELGERLSASIPVDRDIRVNVAGAHARLGQNVLRSGVLGTALEHYERALALDRQLLAETPDDIGRRHAVSVMYNYIGFVKLEMLDLTAATQYFRDALDIDAAIAASDPGNTRYRQYLADAQLWLSVAETTGGSVGDALAHANAALDIETSLSEADPANLGYRNSIADCYIELAKAHLKLRDLAAAENDLNFALADYTAVWQADRRNSSARVQTLIARRRLGEVLSEKGDRQRAETLLETTIAELREITATDTGNSNWQNELAQAELTLADLLNGSGRTLDAAARYTAAAAILQPLAARSPQNARLVRDAGRANAALGHQGF
jgi:eukaryotic-like serine/threonine-protein kinase